MTNESIADEEGKQCPLKTGTGTRRTGKKSVNESGNGPETDVKASQSIPTAGPKTESRTPLPEVALSLPSPTLITSQATAIPETSVVYASDATSPMTPNTMQEPASEPKASESTTDNPNCSDGKNKKPTRKELIKAVANDELHLHLVQVQLEAYKPAMDALKLYKDIYGSQSPNLYMSKNKQVAAICQMNGINDPTASRKQRIAAMTCYEMIHETIMRCLEMGMDKDQVKQSVNDALQQTGEFFGLGNKKAVAARNKRKAA